MRKRREKKGEKEQKSKKREKREEKERKEKNIKPSPRNVSSPAISSFPKTVKITVLFEFFSFFCKRQQPWEYID